MSNNKKLPDSRNEKQKSYEQNNRVEHWLFVHELIEMLKTFKTDDWVEPNQVGNLVIKRSDVDGFWVIDFAFNEITDYTKEGMEREDG